VVVLGGGNGGGKEEKYRERWAVAERGVFFSSPFLSFPGAGGEKRDPEGREKRGKNEPEGVGEYGGSTRKVSRKSWQELECTKVRKVIKESKGKPEGQARRGRNQDGRGRGVNFLALWGLCLEKLWGETGAGGRADLGNEIQQHISHPQRRPW
jgi:hypothetical protein